MPSTNSGINGEEGCIANSLPGRAMRMAMENKGLLTAKGMIYAGTGNTHTITVTGMDQDSSGAAVNETYEIPETVAVPAPPSTASSSNPYVLVFIGNDTSDPSGYVWKRISPSAFL